MPSIWENVGMETPSDLEIGTAIKPKNNWERFIQYKHKKPRILHADWISGFFFF